MNINNLGTLSHNANSANTIFVGPNNNEQGEQTKQVEQTVSGGGDAIDKFIEELKKRLQELQKMLRSTNDVETKQAIEQQISATQSQLIQALERKAEKLKA